MRPVIVAAAFCLSGTLAFGQVNDPADGGVGGGGGTGGPPPCATHASVTSHTFTTPHLGGGIYALNSTAGYSAGVAADEMNSWDFESGLEIYPKGTVNLYFSMYSDFTLAPVSAPHTR